MKYKVGDKVKIVKNEENVFEIGEIVTIVKIDEDKICTIFCKNGNYSEWLAEDEIALLDYTWEDFLKAPIGTKVTFENEEMLIKNKDNDFESIHYYRNYEDLKDFKDNLNILGKIIKIEEPTYTAVYEPKEVTMPEIEEMKRLTDELCKTCDEFIKKIKEK